MAELVSILNEFPALYWTLTGILGLLVGSFLNVVIHRLPIMMEQAWQLEARSLLAEQATEVIEAAATPYNLSVPRSACPHCNHRIRWYENIPLLSYLFLRGRCSQCQAPISVRYPMVELLTAVLSIGVALSLPPSLGMLAWLVFFWALIALAFIDFDTQLLPDQITLPLLWLGLLVSLLGWNDTALNEAVIGAMAGYLSLWLIFHGFRLLTGKEGMGYGDFKLFAVFGAWFGWQALPLIILLSSLVGAVAGLLMMLVLGRDRQIPVAFGPYLCAAAVVQFFWGDALWLMYVNWAMNG